MSDKRITEEESADILRIVGVESIHGTKISWEQAEEIAIRLNETNRMNQLKWLKEKNEQIDLNSLINTLRFYRAEIYAFQQNTKKNQANLLAQRAKTIAEVTLNNAATEEDIARGVREMNAANALSNGDISGAFRSLSYFQDR